MAPPLAWNPILVPSSERWNPNTGASRSGGRSFANYEQVVTGPSGYCTATLNVPCNTRAKVLAMRALLTALDGREGTVRVGPFEIGRAPWAIDPLTGGRITTCRGDADAALDPAWDANAETSADLDFRTVGTAAVNATALTIRRLRGGFLEPGLMFGLGTRLHVVTKLTTADVLGANGQPAVGNVGIQFRPWTWAAFSDGAAIEFARPLCTMRLASDDTGALDLQLSRFGVVTLDLVEAPPTA